MKPMRLFLDTHDRTNQTFPEILSPKNLKSSLPVTKKPAMRKWAFRSRFMSDTMKAEHSV